jgi:hypothetical protein
MLGCIPVAITKDGVIIIAKTTCIQQFVWDKSRGGCIGVE